MIIPCTKKPQQRAQTWFSNHGLDVSQGQMYGTHTKDQTHYSVVINTQREKMFIKWDFV